MTWIDVRCQQLIIGAVLAQLPPPPGAAYLHTADFEHRIAGLLYADILRAQAARPAWNLAQVAADCASRYADAGVTAQLLLDVAADAAGMPAPLLAQAYRSVLEFGCENAIVRETAIIVKASLDEDDHAVTGRAHAYARLGLALTRRAQIAALPSHHADTASEPFDVWRDQWPATRAPQHPDQGRVNAEEHILAGLIRHPDIAWVITGWLPEEVFTSRTRHFIYRALTEGHLPSPEDTDVKHLRKALDALNRGKCLHDDNRRDEAAVLTRVCLIPVTADEAIRAAHTVYSADLRAAQTPPAAA